MSDEKKREPEADIQERIDGFNKDLQPLLAKYELGLGALPKIAPDGRITADPVIISMRGQKTEPEAPAPEAEAPAAPLAE